MAGVTNVLDRWWETVLGESTDEEGGTSFDTNSVGQQSNASTNKKIRWLLPKHSFSFDDSFGGESDVFDFSSLTGSRTDRRSQKWGSRKKKSSVGKYSGRMLASHQTKKQQKLKIEDEDQQLTFWSFFDPSVSTAAEEDRSDVSKRPKPKSYSRKKKEDPSWPSDFNFFPDDDRNDTPSYEHSERRSREKQSRDKQGRGFLLDDDSEDENTESSASNKGGVWDNTRLVNVGSDTTGSTVESTGGNASDDPIADLLAQSNQRVKSPLLNKSKSGSGGQSTIDEKKEERQNSASEKVTITQEDTEPLDNNVEISISSCYLDDQDHKETKEETAPFPMNYSDSFNSSKSKLNAADPSKPNSPPKAASIAKHCFPHYKRSEKASEKASSDLQTERVVVSWQSLASESEGKSVKTDRTTSSQNTSLASQKTSMSQERGSPHKPSLFGRLWCRSGNYSDYCAESVDQSLQDESTAEYLRSLSASGHFLDNPERYAVVRMIPDSGNSNQKRSPPSGQRALSHLELANGQFPKHTATNVIADDSRLTSEGPVNMYVYDNDISSSHMAVVFNNFEEKMEIRKFSSPPNPKPGEIVVKVEASTVSYSDRAIRREGLLKDPDTPPRNTPGVDMVGVVHEVSKRVSSKYNLNTGDRVMAFIKWGGNARYATVEADRMVPVRDDVDPAEAACLAETYLSAFQALHIGQSSGVRYGSTSLAGKSILILGSLSAMGKAVVELAFNAGATRVYATAKSKYHGRLRSLGVRPLERNPDFWMRRLQGRIDLLLIADRETFGTSLFKALSPEGSCVFVGRRVSSDHSKLLLEGKSSLLACAKEKNDLLKRTHAYDAFQSWERNTARCKHDLAHLLQLLAASAIRPLIVDRIPLERVERAQHLLDESSRSTGIFVCEPWVRAKRRALYL